MDDETNLKEFNDLDAILVSKRHAPPRCIEIIASVVQEMFKNTEIIYGKDDSESKCRECEDICNFKEKWIKTLSIVKIRWKEDGFVYVTDMGVAILIRKIDVSDFEWEIMVLSLLDGVSTGHFGLGVKEDIHNDIVTIPYDMKVIKNKFKEKGINVTENGNMCEDI